MQEAGPGGVIDLYVWRPGERTELTVKFRLGAAKNGALWVREIPEHGIQAVVVRDGERDGPDILQAGDFILGYPTLKDFLAALNATSELTLRVRREGTARRVSVRLGAIPDSWYRVGNEAYVRSAGAEPPAAGEGASPDDSGIVGMQVQGDPEGRIVVSHVFRGRPAHRAGIQVGDAILTIDGQPTRRRDVAGAVARLRGSVGGRVVVELQRSGADGPLRMEMVRVKRTSPAPAPAPAAQQEQAPAPAP